MLPNDNDIEHLASEIAHYLSAHPDAADSIDGVTHWWLRRQRFDESARSVRAALERLVEQGVVETHRSVDGQLLYSRAGKRAPNSR